MMNVELTKDTIVRLPKGTVIAVPDQEGKRLIAFHNAIAAVEKKEAKTKKGAAK